jgi:hypothetical protein
MALTAPPYVYCSQGDVEAILSIEGVESRLDDDQSGTVSPTESGYLNATIIPWATSWVNIYLMGRYDAAMLATSYVANDCTATRAARRLCQRRGNPVPESLAELFKEVQQLLADIKANKLSLEDVPERTSGSISWRNVHHSRHLLRRNRVQQPISERTTPARPVTPDLLANYVGPELYWL